MMVRLRRGWNIIPPGAMLFFSLAASAAGLAQDLAGRVIDENGVAVAGAKVSLQRGGLQVPIIAVTDDAGRFILAAVTPGIYELKAEKPGYYATISRVLEIKERSAPLEVLLNHRQEFEETVSVIYSAPVLDPEETAKSASLKAVEIIDLPYRGEYDFRY